MGNTFDNAGIFLVSTLFDLYLFVLAMRLLLVLVHADYYNPLCQFVIKLTQRIINPLRRILPNFKRFELATVFVIIILELIKFFCILNMTTGMPHIAGLFLLSLADGLKLFLNILFYAILIQAILSWIQPGFSPIGRVLSQITAPLMRPFQRLIPPIAGFDVSPIPAMLFLQLLLIIAITPLFALGARMAF